eukprot:CAMPEP_0119274940 /NCGR_PEP_ID=MMETSP1329-20130426/12964_1 /TAXON_ID=114041 /ORGANISM="Genus nov. species nov., Strain RCC1024" /LENGTH=386 /DNA_ID=CAMNT_0007275295 /DNA_START=124 /DNA_END=1284 /DNA_ORIENTATION=+
MMRCAVLLLTAVAKGFIVPSKRFVVTRSQALRAGARPQALRRPRRHLALRAADDPEALLAQAAALREEAKALEDTMRAEQEQKMQAAIEKAFKEADVNGDGVVTVEELRTTLEKTFVTDSKNARDASKMEKLLASEKKYVEQLVKALDVNEDGVLQPEEFVPLADLRARLEDQWRADRSREIEAQSQANQEAEVEATRAERLEAFEAIANKTDAATRVFSASAYLLPLLDILPPPSEATLGSALGPLEQLSIAYHGFPFGGLLVFILLSNAASNAAAPRLQRFSARHAIVLDLASAVGLPLLFAFEPTRPFARPLFAALVAASVAGAALGKEASLVPGTGQLTKKFTDDYDATIRTVISATVGTGPFNITILGAPPPEEDGEKKDE